MTSMEPTIRLIRTVNQITVEPAVTERARVALDRMREALPAPATK